MVAWSLIARDDLRAIYAHIALDSRVYARKTIRDIIQRVASVCAMPECGRVVPEINDVRIREVFVYSYRIMYQICQDGVEVLTVVHGRRNVHPRDIPSRT